MADEQMDLFATGDAEQPQGERAPDEATAVTNLTGGSPLSAALEEFDRAMLVKGFSDNTIKAFQADLRILTGFLSPDLAINAISTKQLTDFLAYLLSDRGRPCNPKSYARRLTTLKVFFGWLKEIGVLHADPAANIPHHPVQNPLPRVLTNEQVEQLRATARTLAEAEHPDPRGLLLVELLLSTGMKKSECMGIHLSHLDLLSPTEPQVRIRYEQARQKHKERTVRLDPAIVPVLKAYRAKYTPVEFLFECTARNLEYVLRDLAELAGIEGGVSFESLRWTAALRDYQAGMTADGLRRKLGLSKLRWRETQEKLDQLAQPAL